MSWSTIREAALKNGELVYSFNQTMAGHKSYEGKFDPDAHVAEGYCLGLAIQWCALRLQGKDYAFAPNQALSPSETYLAASDHATYRKAFDSTRKTLRRKFMMDEVELYTETTNVPLVPYGLKLWGQPRVHRGAADGGFMIGSGEQRGGTAMLIWRGTAGAHATAVQFRAPAEPVNYFDANYGHFVFGSALRFIKWFGDYSHDAGYDKGLAEYQAQHLMGLL